MKWQQVLLDDHFDLQKLNKYGTLMTLGNGYMGIRGVHEEEYPEQTRGMYVAGIYNKETNNAPAEIVNLPDLVGVKIEIDHEVFSLMSGKILAYSKKLYLDRGEMIREVVWERNDGLQLKMTFKRMVSKADLHVLASAITIVSLNKDISIKITTGIDGQQTNHGRQHVMEENVRVFNDQYMQSVYHTSHSKQKIALFAACKYSMIDKEYFTSKNRQLLAHGEVTVKKEQPFTFEKYGAIFTSLDQDIPEKLTIEAVGLEKIKQLYQDGYNQALQKSEQAWNDFWKDHRIEISSPNEMDQLSIDFAIYHIEIMTPKHNADFSIGAKGLTGEGYKGHVFWDTEIFILPFHLYTNPSIARQLLHYRYSRLPMAYKKAEMNGFKGAQFPWESALSGEEETPTYAAINIKTGKRQKVASALAEHHIVADIAFAVIRYYETTRDDQFMIEEGLTLLKETSAFWISRTVKQNDKLSIKNVIGPDEYTEFIDNNAYTNYLAHFNVQQALRYMEQFAKVDEAFKQEAEHFMKHLYLPQVNEDGLLPQDDTFLQKPYIDLAKYKQSQGSQSILLDYSRPEVNEMQILKQADVVMLLYLFPQLFSKEIVYQNFQYYENRTIHDSSLSKAIHAIVAMRCGEKDLAYQWFQEACLIDLGANPHSSDEGVHAASLGAIWLAVFHFLNISFSEDSITVQPTLPKDWSRLKFPIQYRGRKLEFIVENEKLIVKNVGGAPLTIKVKDEVFELTKEPISVQLV
ncbi:glycoside hydrolase family 65 protein [Bacillus sp. SD088]|uniref:glycoside hydrolase family 65 protein n=1 Tax=Bacillus sp. SD088 TaxID=2782012 RepID=UPI001A95B186|nr:glycoside hydrolase family 65 protein [Bacillus sp. SD088]MBO0995726.1 glycoside hydrolase family 65 protein [Bacillus sp. SD088]